jgi:serine/threonine protein kinase
MGVPTSGRKSHDLHKAGEARSAAAVTHANIATVHDVGEADGHVFIAMELVERRSNMNLPDFVFPQMCVTPRNSNVSGLP